MEAFRRVAGTIALCALLLIGAAGLSGHMRFEDCVTVDRAGTVEGTRTETGHRWWPPGYECRYSVSAGWTAYAPASSSSSVAAGGSVPAFLVTLLAGALLWLLVARSRPHVPPALRLTAATALAFAAVGAGAVLAAAAFGLFVGWVVGVPLAYLADRHLRTGGGARRPPQVGLAGAAVAAAAVAAAAFGLLLGLGLGAFASVLAAVALLAARPWRRPLAPARPG